MERVPRRWYQLHLSTCVVLMFAAAPLVWANVQDRQEAFSLDPRGRFNSWICLYKFGWPLTMHQGFRPMPEPTSSEHLARNSFSPQPYPYIKPEFQSEYRQRVSFDGEWVLPGLLFNSMTAVLTLVTAGGVCELLTRRRSTRRG